MFSSEQIELIRSVGVVAESEGISVYAVGGIVRDLVRGQILCDRDIDFLVDGSAELLAAAWVQRFGGQLKIFTDFLTAKVVAAPMFQAIRELDFASARTEVYEIPGKLPKVVPGRLAEDLRRRDFTINALALPLERLIEWIDSLGEYGAVRTLVVDQFQGLADLDARVVRVLHAESFRDDPTRIFRGCRYVARLQGQFAPETEQLIHAARAAGALTTIAPERMLNEIRKIAAERPSANAATILQRLDIWRAIGWLRGEADWPVVLAYLQRLDRLQLEDGDLWWELWMIGFVLACGETEPFVRFGLGKKRLNRWAQAIAIPTNELSSERTGRMGQLIAFLQGADEGRRGTAEKLLMAQGVVTAPT